MPAQTAPIPETSPRVLQAFAILRPQSLKAPVLFASPHSGCHYPEGLLSRLKVPLMDLRRTEDAFVNELFAPAVAAGAVLIEALYARSYVDLNRDARELDAGMFHNGVPRTAGMPSARVRAGLGCLPRVGASGRDIYAAPLDQREGRFRLSHVHDAYHAALVDELKRFEQDYAECFLIDCHSMPSRQPGRTGLPDIVLGDRFGSSCDGRLTSVIERSFRQQGLKVVRNAPYAGGYTTRRYGRPRRGRHVLQIEINRGLYMDEANVVKSAGFAALQQQITGVISEIIAFVQAETR